MDIYTIWKSGGISDNHGNKYPLISDKRSEVLWITSLNNTDSNSTPLHCIVFLSNCSISMLAPPTYRRSLLFEMCKTDDSTLSITDKVALVNIIKKDINSTANHVNKDLHPTPPTPVPFEYLCTYRESHR